MMRTPDTATSGTVFQPTAMEAALRAVLAATGDNPTDVDWFDGDWSEEKTALAAGAAVLVAHELRAVVDTLDPVADPAGDAFQHGEAAARRHVRGQLLARAAELTASLHTAANAS